MLRHKKRPKGCFTAMVALALFDRIVGVKQIVLN